MKALDSIGTNKALWISGEVDEDIELMINLKDDFTSTWINEEDAKRIIDHLRKVFEIE